MVLPGRNESVLDCDRAEDELSQPDRLAGLRCGDRRRRDCWADDSPVPLRGRQVGCRSGSPPRRPSGHRPLDGQDHDPAQPDLPPPDRYGRPRHCDALRRSQSRRCRTDPHLDRSLGIDCDYERKAAYTYTCDPKPGGRIRAGGRGRPDPGFDAQVLDRAPLPFPTAGALCFPDQAQFNPASYLVALARAVEATGRPLFEQSRATSFDQDDGWRIGTRKGRSRPPQVVIATNMTVKSPVGYANRTQPRSHVAMAFRLDGPGRG